MKNVTFLGVEGSGKTVLTTALVNVFKEYEKEGVVSPPRYKRVVPFLGTGTAIAGFKHDATPNDSSQASCMERPI